MQFLANPRNRDIHNDQHSLLWQVPIVNSEKFYEKFWNCQISIWRKPRCPREINLWSFAIKLHLGWCRASKIPEDQNMEGTHLYFVWTERQKGCRKVILCLVNSCQLSMKIVHISGWCCHVLSCNISNQNGDKSLKFHRVSRVSMTVWRLEEWRWTPLCVTFNMIPGLESLQSSDQISDFCWK